MVALWQDLAGEKGRQMEGGTERGQLPGQVPTGVQLEEVRVSCRGDLSEDLSSILSNQVFGANYR